MFPELVGTLDCFQELAIQFYPWNSAYLLLFEIVASEKEFSFVTQHAALLRNTFETIKNDGVIPTSQVGFLLNNMMS